MRFYNHTNKNGYRQQCFLLESEEIGKPKFPIIGKLKKSGRKQFTMNTDRSGSDKTVYLDEQGNEFIKQRGFYWKFPEQVEY